jgi:Holliday junction resolvase
MGPRARKIRENALQAYLIQKIREGGGFAIKIESKSRRGVPDLLVIWRKYTLFIEVKMLLGKTMPIQNFTIREMRNAGGHVTIVTGKAEADDYLNWLYQLGATR